VGQCVIKVGNFCRTSGILWS